MVQQFKLDILHLCSPSSKWQRTYLAHLDSHWKLLDDCTYIRHMLRNFVSTYAKARTVQMILLINCEASAARRRRVCIIILVVAEKVLVVCPAVCQRVHIQDLAKPLVELDAAVDTVVTLALAGAAAFKATIDDVGDPTESVLAARVHIANTNRLLTQEDIMAAWLAALSGQTGAAGEPEPHGGCPGQGWIRCDPVRIVQQDALVATELFAELAIVVIPRQLLRAPALVLLPICTWICGAWGAVLAALLLDKAEAPRLTASGLLITPHGTAGTSAV